MLYEVITMLLRIWITLILSLALVVPAVGGDFRVLCYHDVQDVVDDPDGMAVSTDHLIARFVS